METTAARAEPRGEGQSETNALGRAKCELKHRRDAAREGFKAREGGAEQRRL